MCEATRRRPALRGWLSLDHQGHALALVIIEAPGSRDLTGEIHKTQGLGLADDFVHRLALGLGPVQKGLVMVGVGKDGAPFGLVHFIPDQLRGHRQPVP